MVKKIACTAAAFALTAGFALAPLRPAAAGASGGPQRTAWHTVLEDERDTYRVTFRGGERALVAAEGDGDIDLVVRDSAGRLVAYDNDLDSQPVVAFTPPRTQTYTVYVVNAEEYDVEYVLHTN